MHAPMSKVWNCRSLALASPTSIAPGNKIKLIFSFGKQTSGEPPEDGVDAAIVLLGVDEDACCARHWHTRWRNIEKISSGEIVNFLLVLDSCLTTIGDQHVDDISDKLENRLQ